MVDALQELVNIQNYILRKVSNKPTFFNIKICFNCHLRSHWLEETIVSVFGVFSNENIFESGPGEKSDILTQQNTSICYWRKLLTDKTTTICCEMRGGLHDEKASLMWMRFYPVLGLSSVFQLPYLLLTPGYTGWVLAVCVCEALRSMASSGEHSSAVTAPAVASFPLSL